MMGTQGNEKGQQTKPLRLVLIETEVTALQQAIDIYQTYLAAIDGMEEGRILVLCLLDALSAGLRGNSQKLVRKEHSGPFVFPVLQVKVAYHAVVFSLAATTGASTDAHVVVPHVESATCAAWRSLETRLYEMVKAYAPPGVAFDPSSLN